ncbi:MAG: hypothetical protein P1V97_01195 [Planctomycetota bacterium]|nr:hypothetical protein [Planctomycetota bacterium]
MNKAVMDMAQRIIDALEKANELESDLSVLLEKETKTMESLETGRRFDAGFVEQQGRLVQFLEKALSNVEQTQNLLDETVEFYEEHVEPR